MFYVTKIMLHPVSHFREDSHVTHMHIVALKKYSVKLYNFKELEVFIAVLDHFYREANHRHGYLHLVSRGNIVVEHILIQ